MDTAQTLPAAAASPPTIREAGFTWRERLTVGTAIVAGIVIGRTLAGWIAIPSADGVEISLLAGDARWWSLPAVAGIVVIAGLVGWLLARSVHPDAPLLAAAGGLIGVGLRGQSMLSTLQAASSPSVYLLLAAETAVLGVLLFLVADLSSRWRPPATETNSTIGTGVGGIRSDIVVSVLLQTLLFGCGVWVLAPVVDRQQAMAAAGVAAFLATIAACYVLPATTFAPFWIGPILVGILGYVLAYAMPGEWRTGRSPQHLSHVIPLDYAGIGAVVAQLTSWAARRWQADAKAISLPATAAPSTAA